MSGKPPCRYFRLPGGCKSGDKCRFSHTNNSGSQFQGRPNSSPNAKMNKTNQKPAFIPGLPRGACRDFWANGSCSRGFTCKHDHVNVPGKPQTSGQQAVESVPSLQTGLDIYSEQATNSPGKSPGEVQITLKNFMVSNFSGFRSSSQVYLFLECINSARVSNTSWKASDAQTLLDALVSTNHGEGLLRLGEIVQRPCEPSIMNSWSFIRGTLPVLEYMASEWVSKSTIAHNVNALYGILHQNFKQMQDTIERFVPTMMTARSFRDTGGITISGSHLFKAIFVAFFEYTRRYKDALEANLGMRDLIKQLADWFYVWEAAFESSLPFDDPLGKKEPRERRFVLSEIRKVVESLLSVVGRARAIVIHQSDTQGQTAQDILKYRNEAIIASLFREYQGPGTHREGGPRHDNDRVDIQDIRIAPTQDELLCTIDPYLPANIAGAPHQYPTESVQRLLDVQFRLLREELVAPIRSAIQLVAKDLTQPIHIKTQLKELMKSKGGRYRSPSDAQDSVIFSIFTNVGFGPFEMDKRGSSVGILMDTPPGDARNPNPRQRTAYWETASKKRLMQGGLVALILKDGAKPLEVFTGLISSNSMELKESAQNNPSRIGVRVSFFDAEIELRIVRELQEQRANTPRMRLLLECPVLYESIQPFLTALQMMPEVLPFADYLRHHGPGYLSRLPITPPLYAQRPGFSFELKSLLDDPAESLRLDANDLRSVTHARQELIKSSRLDKSQAEAMIDVMTREISLIQGPPGTGKSYTGVEIIRVLVQNAVTPIILMAFTNHALDHMLLKLLEQNITSNIVRLGSRSSDERISQFSLSNLTRDLPDLKRTIGHKWGAMKDTEEEMKKLMNAMVKKQVPRQSMNDSVLIDSPEHYDNIFGPPPWIDSIYKDLTIEEDGWSKSDRTKRGKPSKLEFWRDAHDLTRLEPPNPPPAKATNNAASANRYEGLVENPEISHRHKLQAHRAQLLGFLRMHGVTSVPSIPTSRRSLEVLRKDSSVWAMSISERKELYYYWKAIALEQMGDSRLSDFKRLRDDHAETRQQYQNIQDQAQVNLLKRAAVVGCTTTGAAKLVSLLAGMEPRVMVVEEAGQVLEAHVLATLVPSISQVIMIGDPRQLRPNLVNYKLSVDNHQTGKIYRFDQSLMERLSDSGLHMSRLDVQRRMRPSISSLIRNTLYEGLVDNPCVTTYPDVRGMSQNVYFLSHSNMESGGGDDSVSKHNEFEVNMIHALVKHLLRQGCYGATGSIVVLSAYLGQIPKIHARLKGEITTIVDERDANKLAEQGIETDLATVEQVEVSKKVLIRTLDNFQGEEGDIIILSLVRNAGTAFVKDVSNLEFDKNIRSSVGFLKSINRTNVGLSRAKHGLYMLGNAPELAVASKMWATVLQELDSSDSIGTGFPIACHQHPEYVRFIKKPEMFAIHAPDGGCLQPCNSRLSCGHACPYKCHSDDPDHVAIKCQAPCPKLCPLLHPCRKLCFESCGNCEFPSQNVALLCGHILENATCHDSRHVEEVVCRKLVEKRLLYCEHYAVMPCHQDPSAWICRAPCGKSLDCCGRPCSSSCGGCMQRSSPLEPKQTDRVIGQVTRSAHPGHKCDKDLRCGHRCMETCAKEHLCSGNCHSPCRQVCSHHKCNKRCCDPCAPCMESCSWECPHQACPLTCGSPCSRLPCDEPCTNTLKCGHPCLSLCGEPCEGQICRSCASDNQLDSCADFICQLSLRELGIGTDLDERTITLTCQHTFTVETLDGVTGIRNFYARDRSESSWTTALLPDLTGEILTRPVCPTCREPITSRRYGRIFKRTDLDILEHNVASTMSSKLFSAQTKLQANRENIENRVVTGIRTASEMKLIQRPMPSKNERESAIKKISAVLNPSRNQPTPPALFSEDLPAVHFIDEELANAWEYAIEPVLGAYNQACNLFDTRSSHSMAYEGSFAALYRDELEKSLSSLAVTYREPEQLAMRMARMRIGDAPPRTDKRFLVEAFWVTIEILLLFGRMAQRCSEILSSRATEKALWHDFAYFIFERAEADAQTALSMARDSESHRKVVSCTLLLLRAQEALARFRLKDKISAQEMTVDIKNDLLSEHYQIETLLKERVRQAVREYEAHFSLNGQPESGEWIRKNFHGPAKVVLESWEEVKGSICLGIWYATVSDDEKLSIVKAFSFGHSGHFYRCPNGHPYVITECGGAVEESRCPECNAPIGGGSHRLRSDNTQDTEFASLAHSQGSRANPWG